MSGNIIRCFLGQRSQAGNHILRTEGTVQAYTQNRSMLYTGQESLQRLTAQQAAGLVANRHAQQQRNIPAAALTHRLIGMNTSLAVQRIKDSLQ